MSHCKYVKWINGMWRCTHPTNGMLSSEYCTDDNFTLLEKLEYCDDYNAVYRDEYE